MMKHTYIYIIGVLLGLFASCAEDELVKDLLTPEQQSLIGRAVNFNASVSEPFSTRATYYTSDDTGKFNQDDLMRIYRNYWDKDALDGKGDWSTNIAYRTYYLKQEWVADVIKLDDDWVPANGRQGFDYRKNSDGTSSWQTFVQDQEKDSLTWDNGSTLRFRAWSRSNYHNSLAGATNTHYYADYCLSDWVNASGPTEGIPLVLKHQGSRIKISVKESGNEFSKIEISTDPADYRYADNADTNTNDKSETEEGKSEELAIAECNEVIAAYNRMCLPAGVDMATGYLKGVLKEKWDNYDNTQVRRLEEQPEDDFYTYGTKSATDVASQVKRPFFSVINGSEYFITIPYDMSNDQDKHGEVLTLPACTRFRIYLRDINNGDQYETSGYEGKYHILCLSDVKDNNGNVAFPNGMKMEAGISYHITVGYRYEKFTATLDNTLSWVQQDSQTSYATNEADVIPVSEEPYKWWKDAIADGIPKNASQDFKPVFEISNETEFLEFIKLVNGTAATNTDTLYHLPTSYDADGNPSAYGWSTVNSIYNPKWITEAEAEAQGYIFYDHYHAANADKKAYAERDYLRGAYPFYDFNLQRNFTVKLTQDLDFKDLLLTSVGNSSKTPFMGNFDGQMHVLKNVNMADEYIFKYANGLGKGASITNVQIESTHKTGLLNTGTNAIYIAGVAIYAPTTTNSIAKSLTSETETIQSYVVGCIHVGDAGGALVGESNNLNMLGCMQAAQGISGGALLGGYTEGSEQFFNPQISFADQKRNDSFSQKPSFERFMCNYYDKELSPAATAVGDGKEDDYSLLEYIRGSQTFILRASKDYLVGDKVKMKDLVKRSDYKNIYGLAPWHAMNYAIVKYNETQTDSDMIIHQCRSYFTANDVGYNHRYPILVAGLLPNATYTQEIVETWNPLDQSN